MTKVKFLSADEAAAMVKDGDTIGLAGGGGGLVEASALHALSLIHISEPTRP